MTKHTTLGEALAAAQGELRDPAKTKTAKVRPRDPSKREYSYTYASLDDVLEAIRGPLSKHGIAFTQTLQPLEGRMYLKTRLWFGDGEGNNELVSWYPIELSGAPQDQGGRITYYRRYALSAIVGIASALDDDAANVQDDKSSPGGARSNTSTKRRSTPSASTPSRHADADTNAAKDQHHASWKQHRTTFCAALNRYGTSYDEVKAACIAKKMRKPSTWAQVTRDNLLAAFEDGTAWETLGLERPAPKEPTYDADALAATFTGEQPEA